MTQNTNMIEKIRKLLVMSDRATKHEREVAWFKAQQLMAKHHIEMDQVVGKKVEKIEGTAVAFSVKNPHILELALVIAMNFRCRLYFRTGGRMIRPVFFGFESDVAVAVEIFKDAYTFAKAEAERIAHYYYNKTGSCAGVRDEWLHGFSKGLKLGFEAQVRSSEETALMIVIPQEVKDAYSKIKFNSNKGVQVASSRRNGDYKVRQSGEQQGFEFAHGRRQGSLEGE